jgi:hypothetical protein
MRHLVLLLLFSVCYFAVAKQTNNASVYQPAQLTRKGPPLQLTTAVVEEKSCAQDHLNLVLKFILRNSTDQPIIIDRGSFVVRTLVSRSLHEGKAKRYVNVGRADLFEHSLNSPDISNFVVVQPGEAYEFQSEQTRVSLFIDAGDKRSKGDLRPGAYFLQVEVVTWSYMADPMPFREKWKEHGVLWSQGLTSQPMPFIVERNRPISKCR